MNIAELLGQFSSDESDQETSFTASIAEKEGVIDEEEVGFMENLDTESEIKISEENKIDLAQKPIEAPQIQKQKQLELATGFPVKRIKVKSPKLVLSRISKSRKKDERKLKTRRTRSWKAGHYRETNNVVEILDTSDSDDEIASEKTTSKFETSAGYKDWGKLILPESESIKLSLEPPIESNTESPIESNTEPSIEPPNNSIIDPPIGPSIGSDIKPPMESSIDPQILYGGGISLAQSGIELSITHKQNSVDDISSHIPRYTPSAYLHHFSSDLEECDSYTDENTSCYSDFDMMLSADHSPTTSSEPYLNENKRVYSSLKTDACRTHSSKHSRPFQRKSIFSEKYPIPRDLRK